MQCCFNHNSKQSKDTNNINSAAKLVWSIVLCYLQTKLSQSNNYRKHNRTSRILR